MSNNSFNDFNDYEVKNASNKKVPRAVTYVIVALLFFMVGGIFMGTIKSGSKEAAVLPTPAPAEERAQADDGEQARAGSAAAIMPQSMADNPVVRIAKEAGPSIVGISNRARGYSRVPGVNGAEVERSQGSGIILSDDGYILTNHHVIAGSSSIGVFLHDGREVSATLIGSDEYSDLALLKLDETVSGLTPAKLGSSAQTQVGEFVVAIGNPLGMELAGSVTFGIISAGYRELTLSDGRVLKLLQTDAAINPGNSGGALLNMDGEVIGINTLKISASAMEGSVEGLGFAIPIDEAIPIIEQLKGGGKVTRPGIGVKVRDISQMEAALGGFSTHGVYVAEVVDGGPAMQSGIKEGDIITGADDKDISTLNELHAVFDAKKEGATVRLKIMRGTEGIEVDVTLKNQ